MEHNAIAYAIYRFKNLNSAENGYDNGNQRINVYHAFQRRIVQIVEQSIF